MDPGTGKPTEMHCMSRGPVPDKGLGVAIPLAERRGRVLFFRRASQDFCDFMIAGAGFITFVRLRLAGRLRGTIEEISAEFFETIAGLGMFPGSGQIFRELWLYSRRGALRFFRLGAAGLEEIDYFGIPFVNGKPAAALPAPAGDMNLLPAGSVPSGQPGTGAGNSPVASAAVAVPTLPDGFNPKSPIARWLAKRNAGKKPVGKTAVHSGAGTTGSPEHAGEGNVAPVTEGPQGPNPRGARSTEGSCLGRPAGTVRRLAIRSEGSTRRHRG
jgi:hypothetical protein